MASKNRRFKIGDVCGTHVVTANGFDRTIYSRYPFVSMTYVCKCNRCGAVSEITEYSLVRLTRSGAKSCSHCDDISDRSAKARKEFRSLAKTSKVNDTVVQPKSVAQSSVSFECPTCYDLPHRRPKTKPCKCGKRFEPDTFAATLDDAHACANLWQYAARELGPDSFAGIVDWL